MVPYIGTRIEPFADGFSVETADVGDGHSVDKRIADSLNAMLEDCKRAGYHPFIRSSFRTRDEQQQILNERVALYRETGYSEDEALAAALQWVAPPGTSEHELGLAVGINDEEDDEGMYAWLASNAHQYGFILRYPLDKVDVTGISNEPWITAMWENELLAKSFKLARRWRSILQEHA